MGVTVTVGEPSGVGVAVAGPGVLQAVPCGWGVAGVTVGAAARVIPGAGMVPTAEPARGVARM